MMRTKRRVIGRIKRLTMQIETDDIDTGDLAVVEALLNLWNVLNERFNSELYTVESGGVDSGENGGGV